MDLLSKNVLEISLLLLHLFVRANQRGISVVGSFDLGVVRHLPLPCQFVYSAALANSSFSLATSPFIITSDTD